MTTNKLRSHSRKQGFDFKKFEEDINVAMSQITVKDLAIFARQFAAMFNAGIAMARCLSVLSEQCDNARLKRALTVIRADVEEGNSLSESMRKFPDVFDMLFISMVSAGEVGGVLDEVLERLAVMMEKNHKTESEIKSAMSYPKTVLFIALAVFFAMTIFLLPTFAGIFEQIGTELPLFTVIMLSISDFCTTWPPIPQAIVIGSLFGLSIAYQAFYKTPAGRLMMDKIFLKLPLFGPLIEKSAVARFCTIFGSLTRAGVPIMNSLEIVRDVAGNQAIANAIEHARTEIQQGGLISLALQEGNVFPGLAIQMISIGEESGELDKMLMKVGAFYETEVEEAVKGLTSALEPMMIVVVGGIVASVLLSMYLPMFKVFESL
ncbi:type II secretion system F family protein [Limnoraphis robusta Tam1]|uniref:Pilus assembly protein PilC n=1 Tax=Limnoraphis robusta CS-951 TaxID=1637645 RepID=A0A0F5YI79_9CYAN|nr:type II secretion system F family protein [Limnoraphis robusta]KKD38478.1 pilus assembly protein PilC [Limnoraphis robusta CS-951]MEA5539936.1 type II secretion system F family protein [Limnoraphis robusta Tam1]